MFKKIIILTVCTIFFSFLIFITKSYFFGGLNSIENNIIEENYIEPTVNNKVSKEKIIEKFNLASDSEINFLFIPSNFKNNNEAISYKNTFESFLSYKGISNKHEHLESELYKEKHEVRGRMKNKKIKLFGILNMSKEEFISVGVHEFAHFVDLYHLEKKISTDLSDLFYNISWEKTKVLKGGMVQSDFVSGYAMTNKYEDFAESFTYYILHNSDFLEKSKQSEILKNKYDFFGKYLFRKGEFKTDIYSNNEKIKDYYRDITKIKYKLNEFEKYLK